MKKTLPNPPSLDLIFRAFCDRTRLRMLYILQDGECCVGNLVDILGIEQPSASRHLAYLRRAGLVSVRRAGLWCYYSLAPATQPFHQKMLECLACCFSEVPEIQADQARARELRASGGCCPGEEKPQQKKSKKGRSGKANEGCSG
jgi:ArsR family transcriptional regulator